MARKTASGTIFKVLLHLGLTLITGGAWLLVLAIWWFVTRNK